jgi:hypothetical protein
MFFRVSIILKLQAVALQSYEKIRHITMYCGRETPVEGAVATAEYLES